jgi:hypothetical protein
LYVAPDEAGALLAVAGEVLAAVAGAWVVGVMTGGGGAAASAVGVLAGGAGEDEGGGAQADEGGGAGADEDAGRHCEYHGLE